MEISRSQKADFNFDSPETSSDVNFNLLDPSMTCCESKPRSASCMASNSQAYTITTSSATLSLSEGAPEFANKEFKEFEVKLVPFKDDLMQPKLVERQPSSYMDELLEELKVPSLLEMNLLKLIMV
jgi:hypothetical protein